MFREYADQLTNEPSDIVPLSRRSIPGVSSDAYHFGFFEDFTAHLRTAPPEHTPFEAMLQPIGIFLGLLASFAVFSFLMFALREYLLSMKERKRLQSRGSVWSNNPVALTGLDRHSNQFNEQNRAYPSMHDPMNTDSIYGDMRQFAAEGTALLNVVSVSASFESLDNFLFQQKQESAARSGPPSGVLGYSIRAIHALRPLDVDGVPHDSWSRVECTTVEQAIQPSISVKTIEFKSGKVAEKAIADIIATMIKPKQAPMWDCATRRIILLRLVAIAANSTQLDNPNVFLPAFSLLMDSIVDTGIIFDVLAESSPYLSRQLVEVVIQYCYTHFQFGQDRDPRIIAHFRKWKMRDPLAQPHHVLFRYLINLQLGLHTLESHSDPDLLVFVMNRTTIMLKYLLKNAFHRDPEAMVPILSQAVELTDDDNSKVLYYSLLSKLCELHINCCMGDMLRRRDNDLKSLIQGGLWLKNDHQVVKKARRVYKSVVTKSPSLHVWWDEVNGGNVYVAKTPTAPDLQYGTLGRAQDQDAEERPVRPGSWKSTGGSARNKRSNV